MSVNKKQIGGEHYKSRYQHWDFVIENNIDYLRANASKYVVRNRKKNGVEDLKKAIHYLEKFIEAPRGYDYKPRADFVSVGRLGEECELLEREKRILYTLFCWEGKSDSISSAKEAIGLIKDTIIQMLEEKARGAIVAPIKRNDGMKHPFGYQEEEENAN